MSTPLPSGEYFIRNKHYSDNFAGHLLVGRDTTYRLPIIGTPDRLVWNLEHLLDDLYRLRLNTFVTVSEGDKVWGYRPDRQIIPTIWRIKEVEENSNVYIINDTKTEGFNRQWTLDDEKYGTQVSLELPRILFDPRKHWSFEPLSEDN